MKTAVQNETNVSDTDEPNSDVAVQILTRREIFAAGDQLWNAAGIPSHPSSDLRWLRILNRGLGHKPFLLHAVRDKKLVGQLSLALVSGPIFGRFLVALSYLNTGGVISSDQTTTDALMECAVSLADKHNCRYLELRHEEPIQHSALNAELTTKVHMRLPLPGDVETLRSSLKASVRNQVKKGERPGFAIEWGGVELLDDFYSVFSRKMRDLGTPVFSRKLFEAILTELPEMAELCCVRDGTKPIAVALLVHGSEVTEVPSASSLPEYNRTNANMLMYWNLLARSVERGQQVFDFGRSTMDGPTYKFKKQWGSKPHPATWQYYLRSGSVDDMRPDSGKKQFLIRIWKWLPVWLANLIGPWIVKGIP